MMVHHLTTYQNEVTGKNTDVTNDQAVWARYYNLSNSRLSQQTNRGLDPDTFEHEMPSL
jgi:hypothetical protein